MGRKGGPGGWQRQGERGMGVGTTAPGRPGEYGRVAGYGGKTTPPPAPPYTYSLSYTPTGMREGALGKEIEGLRRQLRQQQERLRDAEQAKMGLEERLRQASGAVAAERMGAAAEQERGRAAVEAERRLGRQCAARWTEAAERWVKQAEERALEAAQLKGRMEAKQEEIERLRGMLEEQKGQGRGGARGGGLEDPDPDTVTGADTSSSEPSEGEGRGGGGGDGKRGRAGKGGGYGGGGGSRERPRGRTTPGRASDTGLQPHPPPPKRRSRTTNPASQPHG